MTPEATKAGYIHRNVKHNIFLNPIHHRELWMGSWIVLASMLSTRKFFWQIPKIFERIKTTFCTWCMKRTQFSHWLTLFGFVSFRFAFEFNLDLWLINECIQKGGHNVLTRLKYTDLVITYTSSIQKHVTVHLFCCYQSVLYSTWSFGWETWGCNGKSSKLGLVTKQLGFKICVVPGWMWLFVDSYSQNVFTAFLMLCIYMYKTYTVLYTVDYVYAVHVYK